MRAAFCTAARHVEVRDVPLPAVEQNGVVVRVRNCGICGSDLHWYVGEFPPPVVCPGHEIAGEVVEVGHDVQGIRTGDAVAVEPLVVCRECAYCRTGDYQLCRRFNVLGMSVAGGLAEYVSVPAYATYRLPAGMDYEIASLTEPTAVCVHGVRLAGVTLGDRVLVLGGGSIGLLSVLAARAAGAAEVAVTARHAHQGEMARRLGATLTFGTDAAGDRERAAWAADCPVDVVIETVGGSANTLNDAIEAVRPAGTVVVLGIFTKPPPCAAVPLVVKEVRVVGSLTYGRSGPRTDFDVALHLLSEEAARVRALITHRFELEAAATAFATAADKSQGAIKVTIGG
jgi:2-desacetyl-2-hydroxyethyl bacteriochlorophyllide A dehydrogenase